VETAVSDRRHASSRHVCSVVILLGLLALGAGQSGCSVPTKAVTDEAKAAGKTKEDFTAEDFDYFRELDMIAAPGVGAGELQLLHLKRPEIQGRNTWMLWTGGNEAFWDWLANYNPGFIDLLKLVDFSPQNRWPRFADAGLIVEPGTRVPATPDRYGLYIRRPAHHSARQPDQSRYGRSSGIIGLRLYDNPNFDAKAAKRWDANRYRNDPSYYLNPSLVRPYRVGMACAFCHVGPHPLNPPANVEEPGWPNLSATIGNQYLRTRAVFGNLLKSDNYYYHLLDSQLPGTLDTSLIPSDNINNANAQNAIFELGGRLDRAGVFMHRTKGYRHDYEQRYGRSLAEKASEQAAKWPVLFYGVPGAYDNRRTPRVLIDGSDSVGPWAALARVYLNIGTYSERWVTLHNPLFGFSKAEPFTMDYAEENSVYWAATGALMDDLARYLVKASSPMRLKDAPGGMVHLQGPGVPWAMEFQSGRSVFARRCIVCHSSKQSPLFDRTPVEDLITLLNSKQYQAWAEKEVNTEEFWKENYLSTDRRLPVTLLKTNAARSLGSNGLAKNMWQEFSSRDYKRLPSVGKVRIWNPFLLRYERIEMPRGGRGYYRPASLVSLWATAPFLHNNSVGDFSNDPSVEARVKAFKDGIAKLLVSGDGEGATFAARRNLGSHLNGVTPKRIEDDRGLIWRLPNAAWLRIPANQLPILVARIIGRPFAVLWVFPVALFALATVLLHARRWWRRWVGGPLVVLGFAATLLVSFLAGYLVDVSVRLPRELPVNLVANLDFDSLAVDILKPWKEGTWERAGRLGSVAVLLIKAHRLPPDASAPTIISALGKELDSVSRNRDHVMDRGHYFGAALTEQERKDLIDLLLTF